MAGLHVQPAPSFHLLLRHHRLGGSWQEWLSLQPEWTLPETDPLVTPQDSGAPKLSINSWLLLIKFSWNFSIESSIIFHCKLHVPPQMTKMQDISVFQKGTNAVWFLRIANNGGRAEGSKKRALERLAPHEPLWALGPTLQAHAAHPLRIPLVWGWGTEPCCNSYLFQIRF